MYVTLAVLGDGIVILPGGFIESSVGKVSQLVEYTCGIIQTPVRVLPPELFMVMVIGFLCCIAIRMHQR